MNPSEALAVALAAAATIEACPACQEPENLGLCHLEKCQNAVLPRLKESSLARDAHSGMYYEAQIDQLEKDAATKRAERRNERREKKQAERAAHAEDSARLKAAKRLVTAMGGTFTRTRHRKVA